MKPLRAAWMAILVPVLCAQTVSVHDLVATARQRIQQADARIVGHLIWAPATGARISYPLTIRAHWFPGVLRIRVDIGQPPSEKVDKREHILLEMRPDGDDTIRVANPGDKAPRIVPFEKWNANPLTPGFSYEDFLEDQSFWPGQTSEGMAKYGARNCMIIKSTPGPGEHTQYSAAKSWIDPTIAFPVYVEKTVKETGAVKEETSFGIRHDEGVWSASQIQVQVRGQAGSTFLTVDRGSAKANLTADDFSAAQLIKF